MSARSIRATRFVVCALAIVVASCTTAAVPGTEPEANANRLTSVIAGNAEASTMSAAIARSGVAGKLSGDGPYTILVPVNSAFGRLPAGMMDHLLGGGHPEVLASLVGYHVIPGRYKAAEFRDGQRLPTLQGGTVSVQVKNGLVSIGGVSVRTADLEADNGVVHLIDGVLTSSLDARSLLAAMPNLSRFRTLMEQSGGIDRLGKNSYVTLFAPTNGAMESLEAGFLDRLTTPGNASLLTKVVDYHMVEGILETRDMREDSYVTTLQGKRLHIAIRGGRQVNGANMISTDIRVSNGVIHVVDGLLRQHLDILDMATLSGFGGFVTSVNGLKDAGLTAALRGAVITLFAPSDVAWGAAVQGKSNDQIAVLVRNHLAWGWLDSKALASLGSVTTLSGDVLKIGTASGLTLEGPANHVTLQRQFTAGNGAVHEVDAVLVP